MNISDLLQRLHERDSTAASELVQAYYADVSRLALSILDDRSEAEDATQEAFITVLDALDSYRSEASFKTWLFSIVINICRKRWRKRKAVDRLKNALDSAARLLGVSSTRPEEIVMKREAKTALWEEVENVGEKLQLPLILFYQYEFPVVEIAHILNIPVGTVLTRLHTERGRLAEKLTTKIDVIVEAGE